MLFGKPEPDALRELGGQRNPEERTVPGKIDPLVLAHLRASEG
jgi:hypothetical protein